MTDTTPTPQSPRPRPAASCRATCEADRPDVPLGVWPVAQTTAQWQRSGRYLPAVARHPGKMLPELVRCIVAEYSPPGALVVDPMCGIGTTLAEAALLGRWAVGVELEARWASLAEANLDHMLDESARRRVEVRRGDARRLTEVCADLAGRVDLVVTSPPYGCDAGMIDKQAWLAGGRLCPADTLNYSTDRANLGHARGRAYEQAMAEIYAGCARVVCPGGHLVVVTKNTRRKGRTLDLAGLTVALATAAGFSYLGHVIALHAAIRDGDLVGRPSYWQATQIRHARAKGEPAHLVAHEDVSVFTRSVTREETADAR
jgi:modification methylase